MQLMMNESSGRPTGWLAAQAAQAASLTTTEPYAVVVSDFTCAGFIIASLFAAFFQSFLMTH